MASTSDRTALVLQRRRPRLLLLATVIAAVIGCPRPWPGLRRPRPGRRGRQRGAARRSSTQVAEGYYDGQGGARRVAEAPGRSSWCTLRDSQLALTRLTVEVGSGRRGPVRGPAAQRPQRPDLRRWATPARCCRARRSPTTWSGATTSRLRQYREARDDATKAPGGPGQRAEGAGQGGGRPRHPEARRGEGPGRGRRHGHRRLHRTGPAGPAGAAQRRRQLAARGQPRSTTPPVPAARSPRGCTTR